MAVFGFLFKGDIVANIVGALFEALLKLGR